MRTFTIFDGKAYHLIYTNNVKNFEKALPTVRKMVDSFEITTQNETMPRNSNQITSDMSTYGDPLGIKMQYPFDWIVDVKDDHNLNDERHTQLVGFLSPSGDGFVERLGVHISNLQSQNMPIEEYVNNYISQMIRFYLLHYLN